MALYVQLTDQKTCVAITLAKEANLTQKIAKKFNFHHLTVSSMIKLYLETSDIQRTKGLSRKCANTIAEDF